MKAMAIDVASQHKGGALMEAELPRPVPRAGEVLIRVAYAGVNRADLLQRAGLYPPPEGASPLPGLEVSGVIEETGERVCALLSGGGYAEYCTAPAGHVLPVPENIPLAEAAALPEALCTVWLALMERANLRPGERVLIEGAAGGIGLAAIHLCVWRGARAFAVAGSAEKAAACLEAGAERVYRHDLQEQPEPVDVILAMTAGAAAQRHLDGIAVGGRIVQIGLMGGNRAEIALAPLLSRQAAWHGMTLRAESAGRKVEIIKKIKENLWVELGRGHFRPRLDAVFPLEAARQAHERMEKRLNIGKIVLKL